MKKIINIPYYSEFEEIDGSKEHIKVFKRRSCGIVSVKMILDYLSDKYNKKRIPLNLLIKSSLKNRAYRLQLGQRKDYGWIHSRLVQTIQEFGFKSFRHSYLIRPSDIQNIVNENHNAKSIILYKEQVISESLYTIKKSIDLEIPIIISINKNLGKKNNPHLVVLTGYKFENNNIVGIYLNDPNNPKKNSKDRLELKNKYINKEEFIKIWRKTAIFIER